MNSIRNKIDRQIYARQEAEAEARRLAPIIATNTQSLKAAETGTKAFWSRELAEVHQSLNRQTPSPTSWMGAIVPTESNESPMLAGIDFGVSLPTIASVTTESEARARGAAEKKAFQAFADNLTQKTGYTLNESGLARLILYAMSQARGRQADLTLTSSWFASFERALQLGAFSEDEVGFDDSLKTPEPPTPEPAFNLERTDLSSRDGDRLAHRAVTENYFGVEVAQLWSLWIKSLDDNFGYRPSETIERQVAQYFVDHKLSFHDRRSFDRARVVFVKNGIFPDYCLTPDEELAARLEISDLNDRDVRADFVRQSNQIRNGR